jgi:ABC-type transport system involved in cytochrome c biogenesis ATPase subunit
LATHVGKGGAVVMTSHQALQVNCDVLFLHLGNVSGDAPGDGADAGAPA